MKYIKLIKNNNSGRYEKIFFNDEKLSHLYWVITDSGSSTRWLWKFMTHYNQEIVTANYGRAFFIGDMAYLGTFQDDDPEDCDIVISKKMLLKLVTQWLEITEKRIPEFYMIQDTTGDINFAEQLPQV